jgi:hypothetical protein
MSRSLQWSLVILFSVSICGNAAVRSKPKLKEESLCYAFIRKGDLWTACQGRRERFDFKGKLQEFAVSSDGNYLVIQENLEPSGIGRSRQVLTSLAAPFAERNRPVDYPQSLRTTCGTIVSVPDGFLGAFDLISAKPIAAPPYTLFACSSDQKIFAGWTDQDEDERLKRAQAGQYDMTLRVRKKGEEKTLKIADQRVFALSPNGKYLAYFVLYLIDSPSHAGPDLCVDELPGETSCVRALGHFLSISDSGDVIYAADEIGIEFWRRGMKRTLLLENGEVNDHPQWITPQVASAMHKWYTRRSASPHSSQSHLLSR